MESQDIPGGLHQSVWCLDAPRKQCLCLKLPLLPAKCAGKNLGENASTTVSTVHSN